MQIEYPEIEDLAKPRHRFMSSYEQVTKFHYYMLLMLLKTRYYLLSFLFSHRANFLYVQRVQPFDKRYQYLLFAAEPYEIIAFKVF